MSRTCLKYEKTMGCIMQKKADKNRDVVKTVKEQMNIANKLKSEWEKNIMKGKKQWEQMRKQKGCQASVLIPLTLKNHNLSRQCKSHDCIIVQGQKLCASHYGSLKKRGKLETLNGLLELSDE